MIAFDIVSIGYILHPTRRKQPTGNETMSTATNRFKVLGVNDEQTECCCCGKTGLKRVVWIEDTEAGDIRHFGTSCAESPSKSFGLKSEIQKAVRTFDAALLRRVRADRDTKIRAACETAVETFGGEWFTVEVASGPMKGRKIQKPADQSAFDAHKAATIDAAVSRIG